MYELVKRSVDVLSASALLLVISPFFLLIMLALRCSGEGEVFYRQRRIGQHGRPFYVLKFATMLKNSLQMGNGAITLRNDPRITPVGKWLRKSKLNELPQIINVIVGDMSVIGPRPLIERSYLKYPQAIRERIYSVPPGITGMGSVVFRDEERVVSEAVARGHEAEPFYRQYIYPHKAELELYYQKHRSLWTDTKILILTVLAILRPQSNWVRSFFRDAPPLPTRLRAGQ